eukprot:341304_1
MDHAARNKTVRKWTLSLQEHGAKSKKHQSKLIHHFGDVSVAKYKATNMNKNTIYQHYIQGKSLSELSQWANKYKAQSDINDEKEENKVNDIALAEVNNPINMDPIHKALLETIAS